MKRELTEQDVGRSVVFRKDLIIGVEYHGITYGKWASSAVSKNDYKAVIGSVIPFAGIFYAEFDRVRDPQQEHFAYHVSMLESIGRESK